jgi:hypothetical protein
MFASVPTQIGIRSAAVMLAARMMCGVNVNMMSVLWFGAASRTACPGSMSERPGMPASPFVCSGSACQEVGLAVLNRIVD